MNTPAFTYKTSIWSWCHTHVVHFFFKVGRYIYARRMGVVHISGAGTEIGAGGTQTYLLMQRSATQGSHSLGF